ncbi:unnamed protein product [Merluccius merluccius]
MELTMRVQVVVMVMVMMVVERVMVMMVVMVVVEEEGVVVGERRMMSTMTSTTMSTMLLVPLLLLLCPPPLSTTPLTKKYDNGDSQFDSTEFLSLIKQNEMSLNLTHSGRRDNDLLLRSLCVDALIELSDENADWKLSLTEFKNCLTPSYQPLERQCALEDEVFEDGAETKMECNKCVCACGNWVCTALTCDVDQQIEEDVRDGGEEAEMTEEEWTKRVAELRLTEVT